MTIDPKLARSRVAAFFTIAALLLTGVGVGPRTQTASAAPTAQPASMPFADSAFESVWLRNDQPVASRSLTVATTDDTASGWAARSRPSSDPLSSTLARPAISVTSTRCPLPTATGLPAPLFKVIGIAHPDLGALPGFEPVSP